MDSRCQAVVRIGSIVSRKFIMHMYKRRSIDACTPSLCTITIAIDRKSCLKYENVFEKKPPEL